MIKYKLHNIRKGRASTNAIGGKRISLKADQEKVISFTDYTRYEKSLESLKKSGIITIEKLTGEKAKEAKVFKEEDKVETKDDSIIETKNEGSVEAETKAPEADGDKTPETDETTEGSEEDVIKAPDSDATTSSPDSDANVNEAKTAPQQNQVRNKNRKRNR